jgi:N-acetylglucosaminyldiphosphoundecaprenol N-acetyl-beta-D-mannosaminyltransferase
MRITLLGTQIDVLTMEETIVQVNEYIQQHKFLHLMGVNADKINMMHKDKKLEKIVNSCEIINADGASVVLASRFLGHPLPERVAGVDLMQDLVKLAAQNGYSIYLLGAKQEVVEKTAEKLKQQYPQINICGIRNGYFEDAEWKNIADDIRQKKPDMNAA